MSHLENITIQGDLGIFRQLPKAYRWQSVTELQTERCQDSPTSSTNLPYENYPDVDFPWYISGRTHKQLGRASLQANPFWLPHGNVYYLRGDGKLGWSFTDQAHNLILKYINDALDVMCESESQYRGLFRPNVKESWEAIDHNTSQGFVLDDLELKPETKKLSYFEVTPGDSPAQKQVAQAVGFTTQNLIYLSERRNLHPRIWVPNPEYLAEIFSGTKDPIWFASLLGGFNSNFKNDCRFFACISNVNNWHNVRGVFQK